MSGEGAVAGGEFLVFELVESGEDAGADFEGGDEVGGEGFAEEIALAEVAFEGLEHHGLFGGFDAFGDDLDVEVASELGDGVDESGEVASAVDVGDEGAVDFEDVDGEFVEAGEGGVTGAEVVHVEFDAKGFDGEEHFGGGGGIFHDGAFGDFEVEAFRGHVGLVKDGGDGFGEVWESELVA